MSGHRASVEGRAAALRREFDASFSAPLPGVAPATEPLLAIRAGSRPYLLRVRETAELARGRRVVPVPGPVREFVGLAGLRGRLLPVYDLSSLLGGGPPTADLPWLIVAEGPEGQLALAFEEVEGIHHAAPSDFHREDSEGSRTIVHVGSDARIVLSIAPIREGITRRAGTSGAPHGGMKHG